MTLISYFPYRDISLYVIFEVTFNNMLMTSYDMLMSFCKGEIFALTQYPGEELDSYLTCW